MYNKNEKIAPPKPGCFHPCINGKTLRFLVLTVALVILSGCGHKGPVFFELVDKSSMVKPGTIAVIAGYNNQFDLELADAVTKELKKLSRLLVMTQQEIHSKLKNYPFDIISVSDKSKMYKSADPWFVPSDTEQIASIQRQLKTDYILVVWGTRLTRITELDFGNPYDYSRMFQPPQKQYWYRSNIYTRLFEFPSKKIIGYSAFARPILVPPPASENDPVDDPDKSVSILVRYAAGDVVETLVQVMNLGRKEK